MQHATPQGEAFSQALASIRMRAASMAGPTAALSKTYKQSKTGRALNKQKGPATPARTATKATASQEAPGAILWH